MGRSVTTTLRRVAGLGLASWCALGAGCAAHQREANESLLRFEFQQPHMGTLFTIALYAPDEATARAGTDAAFAKVAALDRMMTDYDPDSELMMLCRRPVGEPAKVSDELFEVLRESQRISELTDGAFDVTIGPVVRLWRRARRVEVLPTLEQLAHARQSVGWHKLKLDPSNKTVTLTVPNMQLDLGGIAKGFAADKALELLRRRGLNSALVAASGDIAVGNPPPGQRGWRVEIGALASDVGGETRRLILNNSAVSTSGDTEQFVEIGGRRYSHIVDPRTGAGLTNRLQVSIVGRRATDTDALATAACILGLERGLSMIESQPSLAGLFVHPDNGKIEMFVSKQFERLSSTPTNRATKNPVPSR